jgi:hypothetical protein
VPGETPKAPSQPHGYGLIGRITCWKTAQPPEHLYVHNILYRGCQEPGVNGLYAALPGIALWSKLTTLHFVSACVGWSGELIHLLLTHEATLEDVRFQDTIIFYQDEKDWFDILRALSGMKQLQQLTLDLLGIHSHEAFPHPKPAPPPKLILCNYEAEDEDCRQRMREYMI